ncbi:phage tail protein [Microvirga sp. STR05]|uniref:Phage tail protein n=1 Tax=Hymenobacter duratus TaxID=2771356 RepID=A0ABR8JEX7_9BACT|nr:tail fiber protein [Hymenobacter duratus]MBD2714350.1 phage tail protein [Hymenobacter duratus]MBR7949253.1 phage tail protein [Microvirga sp. STR05]
MEPYLGEIRIFGGNFAPVGWLFCQGQLLQISDNDALFTLLGTTYGGDGVTTFGLPNMASRVTVGQGQGPGLSNYVVGQVMGAESVTLTTLQLPAHAHPFNGTISAIAGETATAQTNPTGAYFSDRGESAYNLVVGDTPAELGTGALSGQATPAGGSQPHPNIQPVTAINYIIATAGIWPSQP